MRFLGKAESPDFKLLTAPETAWEIETRQLSVCGDRGESLAFYDVQACAYKLDEFFGLVSTSAQQVNAIVEGMYLHYLVDRGRYYEEEKAANALRAHYKTLDEVINCGARVLRLMCRVTLSA